MTRPPSDIETLLLKLEDAGIFDTGVCDSATVAKARECGLFEEYDEFHGRLLEEKKELEIPLKLLAKFEVIDNQRRRNTSRRPIATSSAEELPQPPVLGEALLVLFCPKNRARYVMGDLEELFHEDLKTKGQRRAKLLYWAAVLRSIGPLLWVKVRKAGLIALVLEIGRRWNGMS
jgi:hypothetical protein